MRLNAAVSVAIDPAVRAAPRPAELLGVGDPAMYLRLGPGVGRRASDPLRDTVIAVLTSDAVRLPCGILLAFSSGERPLRDLRPLPDDPVMVGHGCVQWRSRTGMVVIYAVRTWTPPTVRPAGAGWAVGICALRAAVEGIDIDLEPALLAELAAAAGDGDRPAQERAVFDLLGRGNGLTPSGDDVLAGLLLGARAFGLALPGVQAAVLAHAPTRTTSLSSQLLVHAANGEAIRALVTVVESLPDAAALPAAIIALLRTGHTSGAALAAGLVIAGELALTPAGGGR